MHLQLGSDPRSLHTKLWDPSPVLLLSTITRHFQAPWDHPCQAPSQKSQALVSQLFCYFLWQYLSRTQQEEDRDGGKATCPSSWAHISSGKRQDFFPSDYYVPTWLIHTSTAITIATATTARLYGGWDGRWQQKRKKKQEHFPLSLTLGNLLLFRTERELFLLPWSSFGLYRGHLSRFSASFESRPGNTLRGGG